MSGKKKIFIGAGIVSLLGAIAYANVKFKRTDGIEVTTEGVQKRHLEAIVSASGKIQPKRDVNISADTMGRVTDLAVEEGDRVTKGQFLLQIDPRNLRTAVQRTRGVARRRKLAGRTAAGRDRKLEGRAEAGRGQLHPAAEPVEGGPHHARDARTLGERSEAAAGGPAVAGTAAPHAGAAHGVRERDSGERALRSQQGADRVADCRHRHPPEHRGRGNGRHRHDEQCRHRAADDCRHVDHPGGSRGRRDRHSERRASDSRRR